MFGEYRAERQCRFPRVRRVFPQLRHFQAGLAIFARTICFILCRLIFTSCFLNIS